MPFQNNTGSVNEFFLVTSPESSGSPPKRAPPPIPALAPSPIPILTPSPAPVLASSPLSALETSDNPPLAASAVMSSLSKSVSLNSSRDRELTIDDIDVDDLEDDDADEIDSLRTSRRKPNDAADLVLGLPPFATGNYSRYVKIIMLCMTIQPQKGLRSFLVLSCILRAIFLWNSLQKKHKINS